MSDRKALLSYLVVFFAASLLAGIPYRLGIWGKDVLGCTLHREPGTFLAYCTSEQYGDYEHGAYYFDLEPEVLENLRKAKVLFLGNSRSQFAFSTDEVRSYFNERSIPFYVMGFGFQEGHEFATWLVRKYNLKPKMLVVVSDPFFGTSLSPPANAIYNDFDSFWERHLKFVLAGWDYLTKKLFNNLQPKICDLHAALCASSSPTIYRSAKDGFWIWVNIYRPPEFGQFPIDPARRVPLARESATSDQKNAEQLFEAAGVTRSCTVLTVIPNSAIDAEPYTVELGNLLGLQVALPKLDGLTTIDHRHLTWSSAQRWSRAFLREIDSRIAECASSGPASGKF